MEKHIIKEEPDLQKKNIKMDDVQDGEPPELSHMDDNEISFKYRRLLLTFVNHARDQSIDKGDNMIKLISNLAVGTINFDEFEKGLYDVTKTTPRHVVATYLKAYMPVFQKDMMIQARNNKMSVTEYVTNQMLEDDESPPQKRIRRCDEIPTTRPPLVPVHPLSNTSSNKSNEEQWRNIDVMLNCILSMVEKTIAAIGILQGRTAEDLMSQTIRLAEDRVQQVIKRAEEAVAEVNRKALLELQRAVSAAETRVNQLAVNDIPKRNLDKSSAQNTCWNCGRKAEETCSGCNLAKYCGSFCQHKDWESHHTTCRNKFK